jgi:8-oxo-dGTP pyrophosphatase MutT (NUDIX family)
MRHNSQIVFHKKPRGKASGRINKEGKWIWENVKWEKCCCGLWHSNRFIPSEFWNQSWNNNNDENRKKVGIILTRDKSEIWITQSYHNCYGFPKGEKEPFESVEECAKREFKEETGCSVDKLDLSKTIAIRTAIENIQYIFYIIHVPKTFELSTFPIDNVEITSCGWFPINRISELKLSKAMRRVFEMYKRNIWIINKV